MQKLVLCTVIAIYSVTTPGSPLPAADTLHDSSIVLDKMYVRGKRTPPTAIDITSKESLVGRTDDLNEILFFAPGVARVPDAGSLILVHGESIYDNTCLIRDVPVFVPSHFPGSSVADRSIVPMALPNQVSLLTRELPTVSSSRSGSALIIEPGLLRSLYRNPKPELALQYGSLGADLSLSVPIRRGKDYYQLTWRPSDEVAIWWNKNDNNYGTLDQPVSYTDVQFLGEQTFGTLKTEQLLWLSKDEYLSWDYLLGLADQERWRRPWGLASFGVSDSTRFPQKYQVGYSDVYSLKNDLFDRALVTRFVEKSTGVANIRGKLHIPGVRTEVGVRLEAGEWNGHIQVDEVSALSDTPSTDIKLVPSRTTFSGKTGSISLSGKIVPDFMPIASGLDFATGLFYPGWKPFFSPEVWALISPGEVDMRISAGWMSSQPDVRGFPDAAMMQRLSTTYVLNLTAFPVNFGPVAMGAEAFAKIKNNLPLPTNDPLLPSWDASRNAMLLAGGIDIQSVLTLGNYGSLSVSNMFTQSKVREKGTLSDYEWEVPWLTKGVLTINVADTIIRAHLLFYGSSGLPYRTPVVIDSTLHYGEGLSRMPWAKSIDVKVEIRHPVEYHRHIRQYEGYIVIKNPVDGIVGFFSSRSLMNNVQQYYWGSGLSPIPVITGMPSLHIGMRIILKL